MIEARLLTNARTSVLAFWIGAAAVTAGVLLHVPMFIKSSDMNYMMADMAMDSGMVLGMGLIVAGTLLAGYGLLPVGCSGSDIGSRPKALHAVEALDGRLTRAHWWLMATIALALVIDTMKPASLGFVVPGMLKEYGLSRPHVAVLPFFALMGTTVGSLLWGLLADIFGRRAAILLAAIMFIGTSICGAMPSFAWNIFMCFMMGMSAGGMLPIAFTLLTETVPARHRGALLVLVGGIGQLGGYVVSSACAAWLEPHFGWRIMWFLGLPTGVLLVLLNRFIPESPGFLMAHGREAEAGRVLADFGADLARVPPREAATSALKPLLGLLPVSFSLNLAAVAWGLVNFGLILWLPTDLRARGYTVQGSDTLLALSALTALPTAAFTAWLYSFWSAKGTVILLFTMIALALVGLGASDRVAPLLGESPMPLLVLLIVGANGVIAALLPYSAESYPMQFRGRGTGFVAGSSKLGGMAAQIVSMLQTIPALGSATLVLALPVVFAAALIGLFAVDTRGRHHL